MAYDSGRDGLQLREQTKIGDGSKKTFQTVMGSWHEDFSKTSKMGEKQVDEETWGLEAGYSSDSITNLVGVALIKSSIIIYCFSWFLNSGIPRYICQ